MKNRLRVLGITLLCGPFLLSAPLSFANAESVETKSSTSVVVPAAETESSTSIAAPVPATESSTTPSLAVNENNTSTSVQVDETTPSVTNDDATLRAELQNLVNQGNNAIANAHLYTEASIAKLQTAVSNAQACLDYNLDYSVYISSMNYALNSLVLITTEPSTTEPSTTEPSTTEPSTTEPSTTEPSTTEPSTTKPIVTKKPSIQVSDKTMYVGDKLTENDILSWAKFENTEGLNFGYEIVGSPIKVTVLGNTLVRAGTHKIRFYIEGTDLNGEKINVEKIITLTILETKQNIDNNESKENPLDIEDSRAEITDPVETVVEKPKAISTATKYVESVSSEKSKLPETGESSSSSLVVLGIALLGISLYVGTKSRKKFI
ncbi:LPXTG cell wall anchor domain-containing protein [Candidatus Enterococcus murrayae]|uniref:LPXTG cell wall anchor domain-containing protein n=1 Tax=Candidatus Enterococcus murrayae TaxID=2815321 RepID=A0ABS3HD38_9ENTE|nr:LPXTG cell wall anchor domain-containing protein [Enterococcus sp. MJM16]MBO0450947.1 LPXTG cell wall anchor domain-containing protein [Enterococcus sp. MJM16]